MMRGFEVQEVYLNKYKMAKTLSILKKESPQFEKACKSLSLNLAQHKHPSDGYWSYDVSKLSHVSLFHLGEKFMMQKVKQGLGLNEASEAL